MHYATSAGRVCSVFGCNNSQRKNYRWNEEVCSIHPNQKHRDCPCLVPFRLHVFPTCVKKRKEWLDKINRKGFNPMKKSVVCSIHFIDGRPTQQNPLPQLLLGYEPKVQCDPHNLVTTVPNFTPRKKHNTRSVTSINEDADVEHNEMSNIACNENREESCNEEKEKVTGNESCNCKTRTMVDKAVQWEDPSLVDHGYTNRVDEETDIPYFTVMLNEKDLCFSLP